MALPQIIQTQTETWLCLIYSSNDIIQFIGNGSVHRSEFQWISSIWVGCQRSLISCILLNSSTNMSWTNHCMNDRPLSPDDVLFLLLFDIVLRIKIQQLFFIITTVTYPSTGIEWQFLLWFLRLWRGIRKETWPLFFHIEHTPNGNFV